MSNPPKFGAAVVAVGLASALALSACSSSSNNSGGNTSGGSKSSGSYKIAELQDLTGPYAQPGTSEDAGMQAYVKTVNKAGGVNGKQIDMSVTDTQSTDAGHMAGMQKVLGASPVAIMQGGDSSFAAILPLIKQSKIPFFTAGAPDDSLYPNPVSNVYMVQASASQQAAALAAKAKAALGSLEGKKIAFYGIQATYIDGLVKVLTDKLEAEGASLIETERFPVTIVSFTAQAGKIAGNHPDAVIFTGTSAASAAGMKALADAGIKGPIIGYSSSSSDATLKGTGVTNATGMRTTSVPTADSAITKAAAAVGLGGKAIDANFTLGWETAAILVEGLKECGADCSAAQLNTTLEKISSYDVPGAAIYGPISISATKHAALSDAQFFKFDGTSVVKDGDPVSMGS
jgi:branched-chain amino acid transport system substrate-binding protein